MTNDTTTDTTTELAGQPAAYWHAWLTTDQTTGEDTGRLGCPGSRYGYTAREVAYWAIAAAVVAEADNGPGDTEEALDAWMGYAVNDDGRVADRVWPGRAMLGADVADQLDWAYVDDTHRGRRDFLAAYEAVSYTHLTLPTILRV